MDENKKVQRLGPEHQPFQTSDGILAFALYLAGVPFVTRQMWCRNTYTLELLRKLGFNGKDVREAAKLAVKLGKKGNLQFLFQHADRLGELLHLFSKQEQRLKDAEGE